MKRFFALLLLPLFLAGCGYGSTSQSTVDVSTATPQSGTVQVTLKNMSINPSTIVITPGTQVVWTNEDSVEHNMVSDNGSWTKGSNLGRGQTFTTTLTQVGTYTYHCSIHPTMKGTIVVKSQNP